MKKTPLKPRNGHTLAVLIAARISGCQNQKELSLDDQVDYGKEITADEYDGEATFHIICTKGKGEQLDRPELAEIETLLRSRKYDLFIVEDLGRLIRGGDAVRLLGIGVDHGTQTIAPNDRIDTRDETWEQDALNACADHVAANAHTSKRIKQKSMNRFKKSGRATALPIHGYIVPPGAKTYDDWQRNESANPKIREGAQILRETLNCSALADWFNEHGVPVGPYCRLKKWDGSMVRRFYANPILKGMAQRGKKHCIKHYGSGHRIPVNNPDGPDFYNVPHLAHLPLLEFDALNAALDEKNSGHGRPPVNGVDPLFRVPRKRTRFPGQHAFCWYCGRQYVWGANGTSGNLMCNGPRQWNCWNSIGFDGAFAAEKLVTVICRELYVLEGFQSQFAQMLETSREDITSNDTESWEALCRAEELLDKEKRNVQDAIAALGPQPIIEEKLRELEANGRRLIIQRSQLEDRRKPKLILPKSTLDLRTSLEAQFRDLAIESPEFGNFMRLLVPKFCVYVVRSCDGGHLLPRAKIELNLAGTFPDVNLVAGLHDLVTRELTIDLFDPPQREEIRVEAVRLSIEGIKQRDMCCRLPGNPTQAAISKGILLNRTMLSLGLASPYVLQLDPPDDYRKLRRHKNARYEFKPLDGRERPTL